VIRKGKAGEPAPALPVPRPGSKSGQRHVRIGLRGSRAGLLEASAC